MKNLILTAIFAITISQIAHSQNHQDSVLLNLVNRERLANGLKPLKYTPLLDSAATFHNQYMIARGVLDHTEHEAISGESEVYYGESHRISKFEKTMKERFNETSRGEVCASYGGSYPAVPDFKIFPIPSEDEALQKIFDSWMFSPAHKWGLMLPEITHIAFAVGIKKDPSISAFTYFGTGVVGTRIN